MVASSAGEQAWDAYWGEQRLAACLRDPSGNYGGCIADAWAVFFSALPARSRVLDLAAGNGAIALLGLKASDTNSLELDISACDAARISPASNLPEWAASLARISFNGGVPAENLPYAAETFDAIASQYGIEYSDWRLALREAGRVLKPTGRVMFICHSQNSSIYATTQDQLGALDRLQNRDLTALVRQLLDSEPLGGSLHQENLQRFGKEAAAVMQEMDHSERANRVFIAHFLQRLGDVFQQRRVNGPLKTSESLRVLERDLEYHAARLDALRQAALDESSVQAFSDELAHQGFVAIESKPLIDPADRQVLGWVFCARKEQPGD